MTATSFPSSVQRSGWTPLRRARLAETEARHAEVGLGRGEASATDNRWALARPRAETWGRWLAEGSLWGLEAPRRLAVGPRGTADAGRALPPSSRTQHPAPRPRLLICEVSCGGCGAWRCHGSLAALSWHPAGTSQWQHAWGRVSSSSSEGCGAQEVGHFQLLRCPTVALPLSPLAVHPAPVTSHAERV